MVALLAGKLMRAWSIDLQMLLLDREARNRVSYQVATLPHPSVDISTACKAVVTCWRASEPGGDGTFVRLDQHLLRWALRSLYRAIVPDPSSLPFDEFARQALSRFRDPVDPAFVGELAFLTGPALPSVDSTFMFAGQKGTPQSPGEVLPVFARAFLLLRMAAAGCAYHFRQVNQLADDLRFWWEPLGEGIGLWKRDSAPLRLEDLWEDVRDSVEGLSAGLGKSSPASTHELWANPMRHSQLLHITQFQRAGLWSLGLG